MPFKGEPMRAPDWAPERLRDAWNVGADGIARTLRRSKTARGIDPGRRLGMEYEELELLTDDGVRLAAWWITPEEPRGDGLVAVLHHHYGGQRATLLPWLHLLWRMGIPSLSFDARGHAASGPSPEARGSFPKRRPDVRAALDEALRRGAERILGVGQSQGAATLAMELGAHRDLLAGVILDSGPAPEMGVAAWGLAGNLLGRKHEDDRLARALVTLRILPGTDPHAYPFVLWRNLHRLRRVPLLWIHGDQDSVIRRAWSASWFDRIAPRSDGRWESLLVPGADHVRALQTRPELVEGAVRNFVDRLGV